MTRLLGHCFGDLEIWPLTDCVCVLQSVKCLRSSLMKCIYSKSCVWAPMMPIHSCVWADALFYGPEWTFEVEKKEKLWAFIQTQFTAGGNQTLWSLLYTYTHKQSRATTLSANVTGKKKKKKIKEMLSREHCSTFKSVVFEVAPHDKLFHVLRWCYSDRKHSGIMIHQTTHPGDVSQIRTYLDKI